MGGPSLETRILDALKASPNESLFIWELAAQVGEQSHAIFATLTIEQLIRDLPEIDANVVIEDDRVSLKVTPVPSYSQV